VFKQPVGDVAFRHARTRTREPCASPDRSSPDRLSDLSHAAILPRSF
jgi:hypothetical protein